MTSSTDDGQGHAELPSGGRPEGELEVPRRRQRLTQVTAVVAILLCGIVGSTTLELLQNVDIASNLRVAGTASSGLAVLAAWAVWLDRRWARDDAQR